MTDDVITQLAAARTNPSIIMVVGVGGAGGNAVNHMWNLGIKGVDFMVCNTDQQALDKSPVELKVRLGSEGLGAGNDPENGRKAAIESLDVVRQRFEASGTKMVFITAGMGGGTGTGASPVIAKLAKEMGMLTVGIVTSPLAVEGKIRYEQAFRGIEELRQNVDSLLIINNESICDIYADSHISVKDALKAADQILSNAAKGISELVTLEGHINLDFRDVESTMRGGGGAIMAIGRARGERRVEKAIINALESPLLYGSDITQAKNILFNIYTSNEAPLFVNEMREIDAFMYELNPNIDVIWGTNDDNTLGEDAKIVILATGLDNKFLPDEVTSSDDDSKYDKIIAELYREPMGGVSGQEDSRHEHGTPTASQKEEGKDTRQKDSTGRTQEKTLTIDPEDNPVDDSTEEPAVETVHKDHQEIMPGEAVAVDAFLPKGEPHVHSSPWPSSFERFINRLKEKLTKNLEHLMSDDE